MKSTITWHKHEFDDPKYAGSYVCVLQEVKSGVICTDCLYYDSHGEWENNECCIIAWADPSIDITISDEDMDWLGLYKGE